MRDRGRGRDERVFAEAGERAHSTSAPTPGPEAGDPRRLGVVGTLVWDTIHLREAPEDTVTGWGGLAYALEAFAVSLPDEWMVCPIVKVGEDRSEDALRYLASIPRVEVGSGFRIVPEPNPRVELRYEGGERTAEILSGGVPPWRLDELREPLSECDALYLNFISGLEMDLETASALRQHYEGPIWADLHSLFLAVEASGRRVPQPLPRADAWFRTFDAVQMNEAEFALLGDGDDGADRGGEVDRSRRLLGRRVPPGPGLVAVTLGARGAAWVSSEGFPSGPMLWRAETSRDRGSGPETGPFGPHAGRVPPVRAPAGGDPTGCGDVWGATAFARLLAGDGVPEAMARAGVLAARKVGQRGASGLHRKLDLPMEAGRAG